jgi:hypothetical protein
MRKIIAEYLLYFIYVIGVFIALKWGFYETIVNYKFTFLSSILLPFIILLKLIVVMLGTIFLLVVNSFLFTNTFKKDE